MVLCIQAVSLLLDKDLVEAAGITVTTDHLIPADVVVEVFVAYFLALAGCLLHTDKFISYTGSETNAKKYGFVYTCINRNSDSSLLKNFYPLVHGQKA